MHPSLTFASCLVLFYFVSDSKQQVIIPPTIESGPLPTTVYLAQQGSTYSLNCEASGQPTPRYEWYRNGQRISNEQQILTLSNIDGNVDEGYYSCAAATERFGTALSNVTRIVQAKSAAFESKTLVTLTARLGDRLTIPCRPLFQAVPAPQQDNFSWKEGDTAVIFDRRKQMDEQGTLYFSSITSNDFGKVRKCAIRNHLMGISVEEVTGTTIRNTNEPEAVDRPPVIFFYSNLTANLAASMTTVVALEGQSISLKCFFSGSGDIDINWRAEKHPVLDYPRVTPNKLKVELQMDKLQQSDEDDYICTGANTYGTSAFRTRLIVHAAPRFLSDADRPHNVNVTVGQDVVIRCKTYAEPVADIQWYKNGKKIDTKVKTPEFDKFHWSDDKTELRIEKVCKSNCASNVLPDTMVIQCNASNKYNYTFSNGYINVFEETKFTETPPESYTFAQPGEPLELRVKAVSDPTTPIEFEWYLNGVRISDTDPRRRKVNSADGKSSSLYINVTTADDHGIYTCNATNGVSTATARTSVDISSPLPASVWIALLALLIILFIAAMIIAVGCALYQNRGEDYPVDETERKQGNNPEQDLEDADFHPFQRKERGSQSDVGSLHSRNSNDRQYNEESTLIRERRGSQDKLYS